nr:hypothetical protein [Variovorax sp. E3]
MQAIRGHQDAALHGGQPLPGLAVDEVQRDAILVLLERRQGVIGDDVLLPDALPGGLEQEHLQIASVHRALGPAVTGSAAARFAPDSLAMHAVEAQVLDADGNRLQRFTQAQFSEFTHGIGLQVDTETHRLDARRCFINFYGNSCIVQAECGTQSTDTCPNNNHFHICSFKNPDHRTSTIVSTSIAVLLGLALTPSSTRGCFPASPNTAV